MRIAVATHDDETISMHFRSSDRFAVFDAREDRMEPLGIRQYNASADSGDHHHHDDVLRLLQDCGAVICGGMGHRAAAELHRVGIQAVVALDCGMPPVEAACRFAGGTLQTGAVHGCCCEH